MSHHPVNRNVTAAAQATSFEALESRQLRSASLATNGTLYITEGAAKDVVEVSAASWYVKVRDNGVDKYFNAMNVRSLSVSLGDGSDLFRTLSGISLPMTVDAGGGDDQVYAGPCNDVIYGVGGNDTIIAGLGNDVVDGGNDNDYIDTGNDGYEEGGGNDLAHGGKGNDTLVASDRGDCTLFGDGDADYLYAWDGNDILHGGSGADYLSGGGGNDCLYGEAGADGLSGGEGNDGMFGGTGERDSLFGGNGNDRFLTSGEHHSAYWEDEDALADCYANDARINFVNGSETTVEFQGQSGSYKFGAGTWSDREIEVVDSAFAILNDGTGNTRLLKRADRAELKFVRQGGATSSTGGSFNAGAWNGDGVISMPDGAFDGGDNWTRRATLHEIGHNWDTEYDDAGWRQLSGWTQVNKSLDPSFTAGTGNDGWFRLKTARFASGYAQTNPLEDFAESFAANMLNRARISNSYEVVGTKDTFIVRMVNDLASKPV